MIVIDKEQAILSLNPTATFYIVGSDLDTCVIQWGDGTPEISKADIQTRLNALQTEYDQNQYQRDRAQEYPPIEDQLDDIFHNGIDGWKASIQVVKDKYPKS
jgi:hypothetical protein